MKNILLMVDGKCIKVRDFPDKEKKCELCQGTGYFKSNTAEFEGPCPNGCCSECGKPINSEWHQGKSCFSGPWDDDEGR
jgi:hypothetical protein